MSVIKEQTFDFGEKTMEYSKNQKKDIPVFQIPKYKQSKEKAISLINEGKYGLSSADFWILMNESKGVKPLMLYSGLIISHNACLKINDTQEQKNKFNPTNVTVDKDGFNGSLVFTYVNEEQGIYEVGEVSKDNCKNDYKYAMALKRLFDRVVLKITKIAYDGIYSEAESDEFINQHLESVTESPTQAEFSKGEFLKLIENQKNMKSLVALFNDNQNAINGDKEILKAFKEHKEKLQKAAVEAKKKQTEGAA